MALVLDGVILTAGFVGALALGTSLVDVGVVAWVALVWLLVVTPLYFALYHAFGGPEQGPGWTPGQHELGICVCDAETGGRLGVGRALGRAYCGLLATLLVVPLLIDLVSLLARPELPWHDEVSRSAVMLVPGFAQPPAELPATSPELAPAFEPADVLPGRRLLARSRLLVRAHARLLVGSTLAIYLALMALAALLAPLLVADIGDELQQAAALVEWLLISIVLFTSGIFWTQAALIVAVEAIRTGDERRTVGWVVRRASERANALTVAFIPLAALIVLASGWILPIALLATVSLVVPAVVLEEMPSLKAFARSWRLTQGHVGRAIVLLLCTGLVVSVVLGVAVAVALLAAAAIVPDAGAAASAVATAGALSVVAVPVSGVLAVVGTAWCLFYYDLRRDREAAPEEGDEDAPAG